LAIFSYFPHQLQADLNFEVNFSHSQALGAGSKEGTCPLDHLWTPGT